MTTSSVGMNAAAIALGNSRDVTTDALQRVVTNPGNLSPGQVLAQVIQTEGALSANKTGANTYKNALDFRVG